MLQVHTIPHPNKLLPNYEKYFEEQCEHIKCKSGCSACCEVGEYPFSRLELEYLMSGFVELPFGVKHDIKEEIKRLKREKPKLYKCPFLVDNKCVVYELYAELTDWLGMMRRKNVSDFHTV